MFNRQLTPRQRLDKATTAIISNPSFTALSGLLMYGKREVVPAGHSVTTAATNGKDEWYNEAFITGLSDPELRFLILHETYHKAFKHLTTWKHLWKQDAQCANRACDYVINLFITDEAGEFATPPKGALLDTKFRGLNAKQVYDILKTEDQKQDGDGDGKQDQKQDPSQGGGADGGKQDQDQDPSQGDGDGDGDGKQDDGTSLDQHDWENAAEGHDAEQQAQEIDAALRDGALAGTKAGASTRCLGDLLKVQVDWREVLREFVSSTCAGSDYSTWRRPNRRFIGQNIYLPSGITEQVRELVVAIDTSCSIGDHELTKFLSEVASVCRTVKPECVRLLYWDTEVQGEEVYRDNYDAMVRSTKPKGGGGTDVCCVPQHLTARAIKPDAVIVFTDGHVYRWGTWSAPLLWCIIDNPSARPTVGKAVHIN